MKAMAYRITVPLLTLLWVYAAVSKLIEFRHFEKEMLNQVFPVWMAHALIFILPAAELFAAILLIQERTLKLGLFLSEFLLIVFTGYVMLVYLHLFSRIPCSCGGILQHLKWGPHLVFNIIYLLITTSAILTLSQERRNT